MNTQFIILAAGKGTRMNSELPKVLVDLAGRPLIRHLLDNIQTVQLLGQPIIVVGHKHELVESYLGGNYMYAFQDGQLGTAHAVAAGLSKVTADNVLVLYGDMPFIQAATLQKLIDLHESEQAKFSMLTARVPNFENEYSSMKGFGRIIRDSAGNLLAIRELVDCSAEEQLITEVNPGIYLFNKNWLAEHLSQVSKNKHGEHYLTDLLEIAVKQNLKISSATVDAKEVFGINTPDQLKQAESFLGS